jgi:hypothetical protein
MKSFNITALIYDKQDIAKQGIFMNEIISALCESDAKLVFHKQLEQEYQIVKIFSIEEICQVAS